MKQEWMHKRTGMHYVSVEFHPNTGLASVTTPGTPYPYIVDASALVPFVAKKTQPTLPIPRPKNKGASFLRGHEWVTIGTWDPFKLESFIKDRKKDLYKFKNEEALQQEVDYIAALTHKLEHMHD